MALKSTWRILVLGWLICLTSETAGAADLGTHFLSPDQWWNKPSGLPRVCGCCPDDYCVKPLPAVSCPPAQCCPDDYCRKPLPKVPCSECHRSCDCYDRKPLPGIPCCTEPWYKCEPGFRSSLPGPLPGNNLAPASETLSKARSPGPSRLTTARGFQP